jgi:DNA-binding SARP family transcriptional activator
MIQEEGTSRLCIQLFGALAVQVAGQPVSGLSIRKAHWVLALLVLRAGKEVQRAGLAETLWPEAAVYEGDLVKGLDSLRQSVAHLRKSLGPEAGRLRTPTPRTLLLNLAGAEVDVLAFDKLVQRSEDRAALEEAVLLYAGPLLDGCTEAWILEEREKRRQAYLAALETLATRALAGEDLRQATDYLRRAVMADPARESVQRTLMQALAKAGDFAAVTEAYGQLRDHLHRELNARPSMETTALYRQIQEEGHRQVQAKSVPNNLPAAATPPPRHIPRPLTNLIGREEDMREVKARLLSSRLVMLTGAGGVGKTRLAMQVADEVVEEFADGAWFVDLGDLSVPTLVPQAVALVLRIKEEPGRPLTDTLTDHLQNRSLLLVLDNCEHLIEACANLADTLLRACPHLVILATSRQAFGLTGEVVWRVPSLPTPDPRQVSRQEKDNRPYQE